jgi:endonuclease YncB( thermonuclease family)
MDFARWMVILVLTALYPEVYTPWVGKAVQVVRPDEIRVERNGETYSVRLYGIDAPIWWKGESQAPSGLAKGNLHDEAVRNKETSIAIPTPQGYGKAAKDYVSQRALGKPVFVQPLPGSIEGPWHKPKIRPYDRFNRIQAFVWVHGEDGDSLNEELLRKGEAWWYSPFVPFERGFKYLEDGARRDKVGLWAQTNPIPPWQWQGTTIHETNPLQKRGSLVMSVAGLAAILGILGILGSLLRALVRKTTARWQTHHDSRKGNGGVVSA